MNCLKKLLTGCLLAIMISFVLPGTSVETHATTKTQQEAIDWVRSQVGKGIDVDGAPKSQPYQCVDLIMAYYAFLGERNPGGNGCDYATNALPSGWKRIQGAAPQPGDILVYTGTQYGHVAIFESEYVSYHQNFNGHNYVEKVTYHYNIFSSPRYWGVVRPNFAASKETIEKTTVSVKMLGDAMHKTMLAWNAVKGAEGYHVKIKSGTPGNVTTYLDLQNVKETSVELQLYPGYYEVYVEAYKGILLSKSNTVKFTVKERADVAESFGDVSSWNWYKDAVQYVFDNGLMSGSEGLFKPTANITRAQLVTTLYRLAGEPYVRDYSALSDFSDVAEGKYYTDAVCWAYAEGIATGSDGKFNPTGNLTRQQMATFFYRYAEYDWRDVTLRGDISEMLNADKVSDYAKDAVEWAVGSGLISGSETKDENGNTVYDLNPRGNTTRAQVAAILQRFCEN